MITTITYGLTNLDPKVLAEFRPEVLPHNIISIIMIEGLILGVLMSRSPNAHICNAWRVGSIIDGIIEEFVSREHRGLTKFLASEEIDG